MQKKIENLKIQILRKTMNLQYNRQDICNILQTFFIDFVYFTHLFIRNNQILSITLHLFFFLILLSQYLITQRGDYVERRQYISCTRINNEETSIGNKICAMSLFKFSLSLSLSLSFSLPFCLKEYFWIPTLDVGSQIHYAANY